MKKKLIIITSLLILIVVGVNIIKIFFFLTPIEFLLSNRETCGTVWFDDYGKCDVGYYCKTSCCDTPGTCVKVVRWRPHMLYDASSLYFSDISLTMTVTNYAHRGSYSEWEIEFKKGDGVQKENFTVENHGEIIINTFGYEVKFEDVDGVNSRSLKATIKLF